MNDLHIVPLLDLPSLTRADAPKTSPRNVVATDPLLAEARAHDEAIRQAGLTVWIGAEPTFTLKHSQEPQWLVAAEGGDKQERAKELLFALIDALAVPASFVAANGRQYPDEPKPRFALGAYWQRLDQHRFATPVPSDENAVRTSPHHAWMTVTPDPGVVEVNLPPAEDLERFLPLARATFAAAERVGLSAERFRFNGEVSDSGGGGQVTLGGPTPSQSPFFIKPTLLPRVLRYLNDHPSLSYFFTTDCVGSASQGPRPDEGNRERYEELQVAVERLERRGDAVTPQELWATLAPVLVDAAGNSHRAEANVEKLWNEGLPERGIAGLVEFRALRMQRTPERLIAIAALLRSICARVLSTDDPPAPMADWGAALHERFALPYFLEDDVKWVLRDLFEHGVGLGPKLSAALLEQPEPMAKLEVSGAVLEVRQALEFWPLVGDVASQEKLGARLVDASTRRLELRVIVPAGQNLTGRVGAQGLEVPLRRVSERVFVGAVRFRAFLPDPGFHPNVAPHDPLTLQFERSGVAHSLTLHQWNPEGGAYEGLPQDEQDARNRRRARTVAAAVTSPVKLQSVIPPGSDSFTLDLRRWLD